MQGMIIMVEAVSVTLGPKSRNNISEKKYGSPQIINDEVTITKEIGLLDNIQNTGVALIRQAATKINDTVGNGTTTATVLAYALIREGMKNLTAGKNPILLKIGMKKALQFLISNINEYSRPVENLLAISQVAKISVGNDFEKVFISQYFITNPERIEAILESSYILDSR
jgi:chaperonin GroEL